MDVESLQEVFSTVRNRIHILSPRSGNNTKIGPVIKVLVTKHYGRYGVEIQINSLANDGTHSWIALSRSVERYVTELALDCAEPIRNNEDKVSSGSPDAYLPWNARPSSSSASTLRNEEIIPIEQRK